ncbi:hypothetical protein OLR46_05325 [Campylobacter jejuni]|nr:hypothetical protein [Campylobacter jejuni]
MAEKLGFNFGFVWDNITETQDESILGVNEKFIGINLEKKENIFNFNFIKKYSLDDFNIKKKSWF